MRELLKMVLVATGVVAVAAYALAQYSGLPFEAPVKYLAALPATGAYPGQEVRVISGNPPTVVSWVWDSSDSDWERTDLKAGFEDDVTLDGTLTVTGATTQTGLLTASTLTVNTTLTANSNVVLGQDPDDALTVNAPMVQDIVRETFDRQAYKVVEEDFTAAVVTDASENYLFISGSPLSPIWYRFEQAFGGTLTPFEQDGELDISGMMDAADTDGIDLVFGGDPTTAVYMDSDGDTQACAARIEIGTVANIDDMYFGWILAAAIFDANAISASDTAAYFRIPDNAGDLDVESELNAGGVLNDDTGTTWTDGSAYELRVTLAAGTVAFEIDDVAVTNTNAVLNPDATDRFVCVFGVQQSAAAADANVNIQWVEIGKP